MAAALSADQELAMKAFIESLGGRVVDRAVALRFLLARKFDAARAAELFRQHEDTRRREGLDVLEPRRDPLRTELATGKFTVLKTRDAMGAAIAVFTASKHNPTESTHQTTLQGLVYQLDAALQSVETQRAGLLFIYDMTHAKYSNFDYDLSQKIITMLKGGYPAKLKKVLIVTPPFWFDGPFRILRLFLRKKLRERVHTVSAAHLAAHVPRAALPAQLGGVLRVDHDAWLNQCWQSFESDDNTSQDSLLNSSYLYQNGNCVSDDGVGMTTDAISRAAPPPPSPSPPSLPPDMRLSAEGDAPRDRSPTPHHNDGNTVLLNGNNGKVKVIHHVEDEDLDLISNSGRSTSMSCSEEGERGALSSEEDACTGQGPGLAPEELLSRVRSLGRQGLVAEYDDIRSKPPNGTFIHSKLPHNLAKNRYSDVLCYDHSRVVLTPSPDDPTSDYINANFVDGYKQRNAFICTQGPLPKTYVDFWQMVWEQQSLVIVMTTKAVERGRVKCGQYWPANVGQTLTHGHFQVTTENVKANQDYIVSDLLVTNLQNSRSRAVSHWQYVRWPDYGVPGRAKPVLQFLSGVRTVQANATRKLGDSWTGHSRGPPIVVHCSAGIGRTGTFLTLDISTCRLEECGVVDVRSCVEKVRSQRAHSIQMPEQYVFCHLALIEYALVHGYLQHADWDGFVEQDDDHGP